MKPFPTRIPFSRPALTGKELDYLRDCISLQKFCGDGAFTKKATAQLGSLIGSEHVLLTTSCTDALEMSALLLDLGPGDEVILPSFTFVSSASAFALRGARIVFVDIDPKTMNIDPAQIKAAIGPKTKAIVVVHYAGVSCDMDAILAVAKERGIAVVEDAAQALMAKLEDRYLGTLGDFGCFSFHETKNLNCGEGGAICVNNPKYFERAEILREKGTNRSKFFRGQADKYTWLELGSSFLLSDLNAAFLLAQLERAHELTEKRITIWRRYEEAFRGLVAEGKVETQEIPAYATHNGHLFYLKVRDEPQRAEFIQFMDRANVGAVFHYVPLHSSPAGAKHSRFFGEDRFTTRESERLVRLPLYHAMTEAEQSHVIACVREFFGT
jgi:dTDP-4-amino-4,6-dideoxygalactose transaminase